MEKAVEVIVELSRLWGLEAAETTEKIFQQEDGRKEEPSS
jgi:hypothetical protein